MEELVANINAETGGVVEGIHTDEGKLGAEQIPLVRPSTLTEILVLQVPHHMMVAQASLETLTSLTQCR